MSKLLEVVRSRVIQNGAAEVRDMVYAIWTLEDAAEKAGLTVAEAYKEGASSQEFEVFEIKGVRRYIISTKRRPD